MSSTSSTSGSSEHSYSLSPRWPPRTRLNAATSRQPSGVGVNPSELVGKVLKHVRRSPNHPTVTLHFTDNTVFRVLVVGYDPVHRGIPKHIEMDPDLQSLLTPNNAQHDMNLTVSSAAMITLADKAFQLGEKETRWDQHHSGIALKFKEDNVWHCIWATLTEYDVQENSKCTFRSYHDVYLEIAHKFPKYRNRARRSGGKSPQGIN